MTYDTAALTLLDQASGLLHATADIAASNSAGEVLSDWYGLESQIRLTASGVSRTPVTPTDRPTTITDGLNRALDTLDAVPPLAGPSDLTLWFWHIHELRRIASSMERP